MLSNGTITLKGKVFGNVLSANGNVALLSGSIVNGNVTGNEHLRSGNRDGDQDDSRLGTDGTLWRCRPRALLLPVQARSLVDGKFTYNPSTGDLSVSAQGHRHPCAPGAYCFRSITMGGGASIRVTTGPVMIKVNGVLDAGGGSFANLTTIPANLRIESSYTGSQGVTLGGGNNAYFTLYAPGTDVTVEGWRNDLWRGRWKDVVDAGVVALHYDNADTRAGWTIWSIWGSFFNLPAGLPVVIP